MLILPVDLEQVFATVQTKNALSALSRDIDPVETMAEQPPAVTPGQYNKIC